jgi:hypothetical protein
MINKNELYAYLIEQHGGEEQVAQEFVMSKIKDMVRANNTFEELLDFIKKNNLPEAVNSMSLRELVSELYTSAKLRRKVRTRGSNRATKRKNNWSPRPGSFIHKTFLAIQDNPASEKPLLAEVVYGSNASKNLRKLDSPLHTLLNKNWIERDKEAGTFTAVKSLDS